MINDNPEYAAMTEKEEAERVLYNNRKIESKRMYSADEKLVLIKKEAERFGCLCSLHESCEMCSSDSAIYALRSAIFDIIHDRRG